MRSFMMEPDVIQAVENFVNHLAALNAVLAPRPPRRLLPSK